MDEEEASLFLGAGTCLGFAGSADVARAFAFSFGGDFPGFGDFGIFFSGSINFATDPRTVEGPLKTTGLLSPPWMLDATTTGRDAFLPDKTTGLLSPLLDRDLDLLRDPEELAGRVRCSGYLAFFAKAGVWAGT